MWFELATVPPLMKFLELVSSSDGERKHQTEEEISRRVAWGCSMSQQSNYYSPARKIEMGMQFGGKNRGLSST